MRDVEVRGVASCAARYSDLFQASDMVLERFVSEPARDPDFRSRTLDGSAIVVHDEKRVPHVARREIGRTRYKGYFGAISRRKRLERAGVSTLGRGGAIRRGVGWCATAGQQERC